MAIDPRGLDIKRFLHEDRGGAVVMSISFALPPAGRELYEQYAEALEATFLPRFGGQILYAGDGYSALVAEQGQD